MAKPAKPQRIETAAEADVTRAKLIEAGGEVFAECGYQVATVREICARAGANVAAVNYYFRDKLGLYAEVLRESLCAVQGEAIREALAASQEPEETLRKFIQGLLTRLYSDGRGNWNMRIMAHEFAQPTPALPQVVNEVMRPRYQRMREVIGKILGLPADHVTTRLCAHSVIGQIVHFAHGRPVIGILWPTLDMTREKDLQMVAEHIAEFTLSALRAMAKQSQRKGN